MKAKVVYMQMLVHTQTLVQQAVKIANNALKTCCLLSSKGFTPAFWCEPASGCVVFVCTFFSFFHPQLFNYKNCLEPTQIGSIKRNINSLHKILNCGPQWGGGQYGGRVRNCPKNVTSFQDGGKQIDGKTEQPFEECLLKPQAMFCHESIFHQDPLSFLFFFFL